MFNKLNKGVKLLLGGVVAVAAACGCYLAYNANEHMIECKTDNFYYIYGVIDENNVILLKNREKLNEEELAALGDSPDGLIMVDTIVSEEAKKNYLHSDVNMDVYGIANTYVYEAGIGPFKHTYEKVQDIMYLTDNTAIKLGLKEGELNYVYVDDNGNMVDEEGNIIEEGVTIAPLDTDLESLETTEDFATDSELSLEGSLETDEESEVKEIESLENTNIETPMTSSESVETEATN